VLKATRLPLPPTAVLRRRLDAAAEARLLHAGATFPTVYLYGPGGHLRVRIRGDDRNTIPTLLMALGAKRRSSVRPHQALWPTLASLWRASRSPSSTPSARPPSGTAVVEIYAGWNPACRRLRDGLIRRLARLPPAARPRIVMLSVPFPSRSPR
jgi:hypothetical protein